MLIYNTCLRNFIFSLLEMLISFPSGLEAEDIEDFCALAQYYATKTPQSFRRVMNKTILKIIAVEWATQHILQFYW